MGKQSRRKKQVREGLPRERGKPSFPRLRYFWVAVVLAAAWMVWVRVSREPEIRTLSVQVLNTYAHDPGAFTQGLVWHGGALYESTGQYGHSTVRRVDFATGKVEQSVSLESTLFGEGLAADGNRFVQLTWREHTALIYDAATLEKEDSYRYDGEGWGLCFDGRRLVMSDGSDELVFRDPRSFGETDRVRVRLDGAPVDRLNELECVKGSVYANVWRTDRIVRIDPDTGRVMGLIDASGLLSPDDYGSGQVDVLNGIAYRPETDTFFLTGKYWPRLFEVRFVEK